MRFQRIRRVSIRQTSLLRDERQGNTHVVLHTPPTVVPIPGTITLTCSAASRSPTATCASGGRSSTSEAIVFPSAARSSASNARTCSD